MKNTDLKFFTNEPDKDLYTRFHNILKSNTQFFDILVGYFRSSGFFKMYNSMYEVEKIRILVGINVDNFTVKIINNINNDKSYYEEISPANGKDIVSNEIKMEYDKSYSTKEIEEGINYFIQWIISKKIEIRLYTKSPLHAKVYILRKNQKKVPDTFGTVITGSSNFSISGLLNNLEFNVELKDYPDVKFALDKFEELWKESTDIHEVYLDTINNKTWYKNDITPYEMFLKTLYEFFKEELVEKDILLPKNNEMKLQYQIDAVVQAKQKLDAYNGVFISDVVGLGKTYICSMLASTFEYDSYKLIVCPPVLIDYWNDVLNDFNVKNFKVISIGKLKNIIKEGVEKYKYIFVDEAHRFRNSNTESFKDLHHICFGKKVILITATPINNYTTDIENQIYLFQPKHNGTINGIKNISAFFNDLKIKLSKFELNSPEYYEQLRENSEVIRDRLIREIMIRRTRSEIEKYYSEDLAKQGIVFPKVNKPEKIIYEFDKNIDTIFNKTILMIKNLKYSRYISIKYLIDKDKKESINIGQTNILGFIKTILLKRLESSFYAFIMTLKRFISSYETFIEMFNSGTIYVGKNSYNTYNIQNSESIDIFFDLLNKDKLYKFSSKDFNDNLIIDLKQDLEDLKIILSMWINIKYDPKIEELQKTMINNPILNNKKIIIFTESLETSEYLYEKLEKVYNKRVVLFNGKSNKKMKKDIELSFNPKYGEQTNKYDILITTDVLSEGINLHNSNIIINYDLPWNPTKIMQRVGRINRIGSKYDNIYIFNIFPTSQTSEILPIQDRIILKLQAFHDTLGDDFKYLSENESISSKQLFEILDDNIEKDDILFNEELMYLNMLKEVKNNQPLFYDKIINLPKKTKTGKISKDIKEESVITFIKHESLKTFFITNEYETKQISFLKAIKLIESNITDKQIKIPENYFDFFKKNNQAFDSFIEIDDTIDTSRKKITGNNLKVINVIKALRNEKSFYENDKKYLDKIQYAYENGYIPEKITKEILGFMKNTGDIKVFFHKIVDVIPQIYLNDLKGSKEIQKNKEIILSCYLSIGD